MRKLIGGSLFIIVTGLLSGCASSSGAKSDAPAATHAEKVVDAGACVLQSGGTDVLRLTLTPDLKSTAKDGFLQIKAPHYSWEVWVVPGASTVEEGVKSIDKQIAGEFKDFKPDSKSDLTVAGSPAKRLAGIGHEADDGDNGEADLIVFKVGGHVFIALAHDEALSPQSRAGLLALVQTAQTP